MTDVLSTPFPEDFYKEEGWVKSLVGYYGDQLKKLPPEVLLSPMQVLAEAMMDVTFIYGKFPQIVYNSLGQTIDPMFYPEEYREKIYKVLKDAAIEENRPFLGKYAEGLLTIRCFFERDKDFYASKFAEQIAKTPGEGDASRYEKFGSTIQEITKIHVNQVRKMIADRK
ncbi:MAG: hypothetical protein K0R98_1309 [Rickettsiaceae bacterium]|jgi:hypothetical protein|nr:hypothetical protein [Rickettsiaceae bacterium]